MNEFEKRINALRIEYRNERVQIQKDSNMTIGHLNYAIGEVSYPEVRDALRKEKWRVYEATRRAMSVNRKCYKQQLAELQKEYDESLESTPSNRELRRMMAKLCSFAESKGMKSISIGFGNRRSGLVEFD